MDNDTRTLYTAALDAGLTPVAAFRLGAYGYILIAPPNAVWQWQQPTIEGWRFLGAAPALSYAPLGSFAAGKPIERGIVLWYIDSSMAYGEE